MSFDDNETHLFGSRVMRGWNFTKLSLFIPAQRRSGIGPINENTEEVECGLKSVRTPDVQSACGSINIDNKSSFFFEISKGYYYFQVPNLMGDDKRKNPRKWPITERVQSIPL